MELNNSGIDTTQATPVSALNFFRGAEMPGSWADWAKRLASNTSTSDSGAIFRHAETLAESAAISTEAAIGLLLWLGSVCMIQHAQIQWPTGIWQPGGLTMSIIEEDNVHIESVVNSFIKLAKDIGIDPVSETVKEGPAGLIARLESAGSFGAMARSQGSNNASDNGAGVDSLSALGSYDTSEIEVARVTNRGNSRALIYPSGRTLLSYLYDTAFFNTLDDLIQHGNLNVRGKASNHRIHEVHMSTVTTFFQGALVSLTADNRVQNNMTVLLRQMLVFWPTAGARRFNKAGRIDIALFQIQRVAQTGFDSLNDLSDGVLRIPEMPDSCASPYLDGSGTGIRYTVLNRQLRIARLAIAVAFWRVCDGGKFEITNGDLAIADSILHMHEMGGRLFELAMSKGRMGHEFMRLFLRLLNGESIEGEELGDATDLNIGTQAQGRLRDMSVIGVDGKLETEYRIVKGTTIAAHKKRWNLT